jgi:hypothetical protein
MQATKYLCVEVREAAHGKGLFAKQVLMKRPALRCLWHWASLIVELRIGYDCRRRSKRAMWC